ncbi:MAG: hypothetical protein IJT34_07670 [Butyrivibrio sp.]|nr:hypothetical protein [Butyrivibrio sp.]
MKKNTLGTALAVSLSAAMLAGSMAGCGGKQAAPAAVIEQSTDTVQRTADTAASQTAETAQAETADTTAEAPEEDTAPVVAADEVYTDANGWQVHYDPSLFEVTPGGPITSFVYTGESAVANLVMASYEVGKNAETAIADRATEWGENATTSEGIFPGTEDVKGYWVVLPPAAEGSGLTMTALARDYMDGALVFEMTGYNSGDEEADMAVSDALASIIDSLTFIDYENLEPVKLPAYEYPGPELFYTVVYQYLIDTLSPYYEPADVCIPSLDIVAEDDSNKDDILLYGNYQIYNYNLSGDLLETVSGGTFPGVIHIKSTDTGDYVATGMDIVEDGSNFTESAKKIFGTHYDEFIRISSDDTLRKTTRAQIIANYVAANNLEITAYQDYGSESVQLPEENIDSFYSQLD